jgi:hypothetical protein
MAKNKYIKTPEELLELFDRYVDYVKNNPKLKTVKGNKNWTLSEETLERPLTMSGFEVFAFEKVGTVEHYFRNTGDSYSEYCGICSHIKKVIRADQIEGGMLGQFNPSITQRLNNLTENIRQEVNVEQPLFPDINKSHSDS